MKEGPSQPPKPPPSRTMSRPTTAFASSRRSPTHRAPSGASRALGCGSCAFASRPSRRWDWKPSTGEKGAKIVFWRVEELVESHAWPLESKWIKMSQQGISDLKLQIFPPHAILEQVQASAQRRVHAIADQWWGPLEIGRFFSVFGGIQSPEVNGPGCFARICLRWFVFGLTQRTSSREYMCFCLGFLSKSKFEKKLEYLQKAVGFDQSQQFHVS